MTDNDLDFNLVIVGGTPAGVCAAVSGIIREWCDRNRDCYLREMPDDPVVKAAPTGWDMAARLGTKFEPHIAEKHFTELVAETNRGRVFCRSWPVGVEKRQDSLADGQPRGGRDPGAGFPVHGRRHVLLGRGAFLPDKEGRFRPDEPLGGDLVRWLSTLGLSLAGEVAPALSRSAFAETLWAATAKGRGERCDGEERKPRSHGALQRQKGDEAAMKIVEKPWGRELWVAHNEHYALKIIEIKAGARSSLQYHKQKHEHIYVDRGKLRVQLEQPGGTMATQEFGPGSVIENPPGRKHRTEAVEDCRLIEVSTPQLDDVVRVEDDYGR